MPTPLHGSKEPYRLRSNVIYFTDWRYVSPGSFRWTDSDGKSVPLWSTELPGEIRWNSSDMPEGVHMKAQRAGKTGVILTRNRPWEWLVSWSNLIYDEGRYRLWYECTPLSSYAYSKQRVVGHHNLLCYAESDDGFHWERPKLGLLEFEGEDTNIVFGGELAGENGFHGGGVFKDPSAPPEERYKLIYLGIVTPGEFEKYRRDRPQEIDPRAVREDLGRVFGVYGAVSPDGIHWRRLPGPLVVQHSDTKNTAYYDPDLGKYVGYFRTWYFGRRCIGRCETDDFRRWPLPETIISPASELGPSNQWYTNAKTLYPGTSEYHLMFPALYRISQDTTEVHLLSSADGIVWSFVPGGAVISPGPLGSWDGGCIFAKNDLVPLPDGRVALPYTGYPVPHKYPRARSMGDMGYAVWEKGRLSAIEVEGRGEFALARLFVTGSRMKLNLRTKRSGYVLVEIADSKGRPLPGRSFADADPIVGDHLERHVSWHGEEKLGCSPDTPILIRFKMRAAELFSVEFV
ncbi:TPA: hypothetical protein EYP37_05535 [Candidatus Poribacteria bacterium]|nr:hypothetical protein [Candidatus Poribacteria bacterium]